MSQEVLELLKELVAIDSQNPGVGEMEAARYVDELARTWGFDSELVETEPGRGNVLITADAGGPKSLMLSGHLDTKAMGETEAEWDTPPLEVTVHDGLAYGLGTSDMKGAVPRCWSPPVGGLRALKPEDFLWSSPRTRRPGAATEPRRCASGVWSRPMPPLSESLAA